MTDVLNAISSEMEKLNINYQFERYKGTVKYPYFVGSADADEFISENGYQSYTVSVNGFSRGSVIELVKASEKIKNHFADFRTITKGGNGISITFAALNFIPQENAELKRIQITLNVQEWSVKNE